jgi:hypothetical protein
VAALVGAGALVTGVVDAVLGSALPQPEEKASSAETTIAKIVLWVCESLIPVTGNADM